MIMQALDLNVAARSHLCRLVAKHSDLKNSEAAQFISAAHPPPDSSTANVTARLYNTHVVKEVVSSILDAIRSTLGLKVTSSTSRQPRKSPSSHAPAKLVEQALDVRGSSSGVDLSSSERRRGNHDSTADQEGGESEAAAVSQAGKSPSSDADQAEDDSEALEHHLSFDESSGSRSQTPKPHLKPNGSSAFLPALTMGGYWSGSETDEDPDKEFAPNLRERRNRRGQRARQAIWEKKFGQGAKHLRRQVGDVNHIPMGRENQVSKHDRDAGWDLQRGAVEGGRPKGKYLPPWKKAGHRHDRNAMSVNRGGSRTPATSKGNDSNSLKPATKQVNVETDRLHPSWEAARQAKTYGSGGIGSFSGSKMTFD